MRLNVGCGDHYVQGWTNIDTSTHVRADIYASILDLPYPDCTISRIYCGHVMEHLEEDVVGKAVRELERVLDPNGKMMFVGPDYDRALVMMQMGQVGQELVDQIVGGEGRWPGDVHHWVCSEEKLLALLENSSYLTYNPVDIREVDDQWPVVSRVGWQCAVEASWT